MEDGQSQKASAVPAVFLEKTEPAQTRAKTALRRQLFLPNQVAKADLDSSARWRTFNCPRMACHPM